MKQNTENRNSSLRIASIYFLLSLLWIMISDNVLLFFINNDLNLLSHLQTYKGIIFILVSSIVVFLLVNQNLRKRSALHNELKKEKDHYLSLFENVSDAIFLMRDIEFIDCNKQSINMFGCDKRDLISATPLKFSPEFQPDGSLSKKKAREMIEMANKQGTVRFEWRHRKQNGIEFDAEVSLTSIEYENEILLVAMLRDISEWKEIIRQINEDQLFIKSITEQSPDIIYIFDVVQNRNIYTNKDLGQILGYEFDETPHNSTDFFKLYMHPDDKVLFEEYEGFIDNWQDEFLFSYEYRLKAKNGEWRWFSGNEKEFQRKKGKIISIIGTVRDITEKKLAEDRLKKSETRFYSIFNDSQTLMTIYDSRSLKRIDVNKQFLKISGYAKEEIIGKPLEEFNIIKERVEYEEFVNTTFSGEDIAIKEFTLILKNGSERILKIARQYLEIGENSLILISASDITEQKIAEKLLVDNETRLRSIVDQVFDPMYICDLEGNIIDVNEIACQSMGYTREEFLKMNIIQTDERVKGTTTIENLWKRLEITDPITIESVHLKKNGGKIPVEIRTGRFHMEGKNYIIGFARDISLRIQNEKALKESELKYRTIIENMSDGLIIFDRDGMIVSVNYAFCSMHGYKETEILFSDIRNLFHESNTDVFEEFTQSIEKTGFYENEILDIHKNGSILFTHVNGSQISIQQNDYFLAVVRDITEKKEMEKRMMSAIIETEEKERERIAKDLHDGLGPILSAIKLYIQWSNDPKTKTSKQFIYQKSSKTIDEAIATLREISMNLSPHILHNYGLVQAINSYIDVLEQTEKLKIEFTSDITGRFNEIIETSMYRIVTECINNTIKHASATFIKLHISYKNDNVQLLFEDNGVGFDVDEAFRKPGGLGLVNMLNRIKSLNGKIFFESKKNIGTKIEVNIFYKI
jgi:PAS domain S-box-containing protein